MRKLDQPAHIETLAILEYKQQPLKKMVKEFLQ